MIRKLDWDSEFFQLCIGRVESGRIGSSDLDGLRQLLAAGSFDCVYLLADGADVETARHAADVGFRFVDVRLTYVRSGPVEEKEKRAQSSVDFRVRTARPSDVPALERIAAASHFDSRFYFDSGFSRDRVDELYRTWIRKSCSDPGCRVLVLQSMSSEEAIGYITCEVKPGNSGQIGLVGLDERARGRGGGRLLVSSALEWFAWQTLDRITVVTQGRNLSAQRLYARAGFLPRSSEVWYHAWPAQSEARVISSRTTS